LELWLDPRFDTEFWSGAHEADVIERALAHVVPGDLVVDVGAHIGYFALAAARAVGPGGRVLAFEPDQENLALAQANAERNGIDNVELLPQVVWRDAAPVTFARDDGHPIRTYGRVADRGDTVAATSLDTAAEEHGAPALIKIDVEGGEEDVLTGAEAVLRDRRPVVVCEVHMEGGREAARLQRVTRFLEERGYAVEELTKGHDPTHVLAIPVG
jgi:FkbM family methyltransferase